MPRRATLTESVTPDESRFAALPSVSMRACQKRRSIVSLLMPVDSLGSMHPVKRSHLTKFATAVSDVTQLAFHVQESLCDIDARAPAATSLYGIDCVPY